MNLPVGVSSVRLENSGTLHHGQTKFVFFEIEHQKALFVENDFSMMPSIEGGRTLSEGRVYPSDSFDTQTLSLLLTDQESIEERLSIAEVLEDEPLQQQIDFASLGRFKKDPMALKMLKQSLGVRERIAVLLGDTLRVFVRLNYADVVYQKLLGYVSSKSRSDTTLQSLLAKELALYALKMDVHSFCQTLVYILMSEDQTEFIMSDSLLNLAEQELRKIVGTRPTNLTVVKEPLNNVK